MNNENQKKKRPLSMLEHWYLYGQSGDFFSCSILVGGLEIERVYRGSAMKFGSLGSARL